jgi:N-acetylmuramoyl-L-alanine amidase
MWPGPWRSSRAASALRVRPMATSIEGEPSRRSRPGRGQLPRPFARLRPHPRGPALWTAARARPAGWRQGALGHGQGPHVIRSMRPRRHFRRPFSGGSGLGPAGVSRSGPLAEAVVAVDVGHGHKRPGPQAPGACPKTAFNLDMARLVVEELHRAGRPRPFSWTRPRRLPPLPAVPGAPTGQAAVLVSIHHDSVQPHYMRTGSSRAPGPVLRPLRRLQLFFSAKNPTAGRAWIWPKA